MAEIAGQALAAGDLSAAEAQCRKLIALEPDGARPWAMLSEIALRRNESDAALANAEQAVRLEPELVLARVMHAKALLRRGDYGRALAAAEAGECIADAPPEALDGLGAIFGMLGRHQRALGFFERATALTRGTVPQFLFNLAATERILGRLEAAEAHCDTLIANDPHAYVAHSLRSDLRIQSAARNHIAALEGLIASGTRGWQGEVVLRFALGKEYEDIGEDARSFAHIAAGAALQRRSMSYQVSTDIALIERVMRTQTRPWLAACRGDETAAPIFVVGLPRSGTTVIERIVGSHSGVVSVGEVGVFPVELARAIGTARRRDDASAPEGTPLDLRALGQRYVESVTSFAAPRSSRFLDKTLQNYLYCGLIHAALPKAKIIFVHRHPMDTCYAIYKTHFDRTFRFSYDLKELADYYLAFRRLARHWRSVLPQRAFREVNYEDVVHDLHGTSRRLIEFLELPWEEQVLRFHESRAPSATASAVQVRRPLYDSSIGRWRRHAQGLEPLRARLAAELPADELR